MGNSILKIPKSSIENHLHQAGYVHCFDVWVPPKLGQKKKKFLTISLHVILYLKITKAFHFLKQTVMGNEKCVPYNNVK